MTSILAAGVVVPARNEVASITACVESILVAAERVPAEIAVVVVADSCDDGTEETAAGLLARRPHAVLRRGHANVGAARASGAAHVFETFSGVPLEALWLACTDADSTVPPDWLERQLSHAEVGADAVAGIVRLASARRAIARGFDAAYGMRIRPDSHDHVHGANLGFRASAYLASGGFRALACGEDNDLWNRLRSGGALLVSDPRIVVATSARLVSRVEGGFSQSIGALTTSIVG